MVCILCCAYFILKLLFKLNLFPPESNSCFVLKPAPHFIEQQRIQEEIDMLRHQEAEKKLAEAAFLELDLDHDNV